MKLDLCKIFDVEEKQHFWIKCNYTNFEEACIINNRLYHCCENGEKEFYDFFNINCFEISHTKPINLTEHTKQFLELINEDYEYIARDESGHIYAYVKILHKGDTTWCSNDEFYEIEEKLFDIDLSFIKWEDDRPYLISDLLGN